MPLADFHFLRPFWLAALLPWCWFAWRLLRRQLEQAGWARVVDAELLSYLTESRETGARDWYVLLAAAFGVLGIVALAGPTWQRLPQPVYRSDSSLVIVLDLSRSMDATDLKPNRLVRARYKIADLLVRRKDGQTALVVYAGEAFTVSPLTNDTATITLQLAVLDTELMPVQGSRADVALRHAASVLRDAGLGQGDILLVTDSVELPRDGAAAEDLRKQGHAVSVLVVGTAEGAPVSRAEGGFLLDAAGAIVLPRVDHEQLRQLARLGGGVYRELRVDDGDLDALLAAVESRYARWAGESRHVADAWREQGPWLVLLMLPLAALGFRRGVLFCLALLMLPLPRGAEAIEWSDLWLRKDQQAQRAFDQQKHKQAAGLFDDPQWKAAAQYRAGDYGGAAATLQDIEQDAEALYNKGNALARAGRYQEAVAAYDRALALDAEHADAKYNRELIKQQLEKQAKEANSGTSQDPAGGKPRGEQGRGEKADSPTSPARDQQVQRPRAGEQPADQGGTGDDPQPEAAARRQEQGQAELEAPSEKKPPAGGSDRKQRPRGKAAAESAQVVDNNMRPETEQWLRRIPDDPGGLLRRKFHYQYQQRGARDDEDQPW